MRALIEFETWRAAGTQAACPGNPPVQPRTAGSTVVQTESREVWGILQRHFTRTRTNFNFQQVPAGSRSTFKYKNEKIVKSGWYAPTSR